MKYFNPSYWFKLWVLSAPLFNNETIGINAKSINNKKNKNWASNNTNLQSINQDISFTNSSTNYQPYNLNQQLENQNINPFYKKEFETSIDKHFSRKKRRKRDENTNLEDKKISANDYLEFNNKSIKKIIEIEGYVYDTVVDSKNNVFFYGQDDIYKLKQGENKPIKIYNKTKKHIHSIAIDSKDNVYFGSIDFAFVLKSGETTLTKIEAQNKYWKYGNYFESIAIDSKDNVYFGTFYGAFVLKSGETVLTEIESIKNKRVDSIAIDSKDNVYFGFVDNFVYVLKNGKNIVTEIESIKNKRVDSIAIDSKDNVYFGTFYDGAYVLKSGETTATKINEIDDEVKCIKIDNNDNVYIGTKKGLYIFNNFFIKLLKIDNINKEYGVKKIAFDSKDNVYFLTDYDIYVFKNNEIIAKKLIKFNISKVWTYRYIAIDSKDNVYFGTNSDFYILENYNDKILKINEIKDNISKLIIDNKNNIYFETYTNLNSHNIFLLKQGENKSIKIKQITEDGYKDNTSFLFLDRKNNFYFGTHNSAYVLKSGETKPIKLEIISNNIIATGFDNNQNLYFTTKNNGTYILKSGETKPIKLEIIPNNIIATGFDNNQNLYFTTKNNGTYILKSGETKPIRLETIISDKILGIATDSHNNTYFSTENNGTYILKNDQNIPIKIKELDNVNLIAIDKNDNTYFFKGGINSEYKWGKRIINKINEFPDFVFDDDNNLYIGTINSDIYFLKKNNLSLEKIKKYNTFHSSSSSINPDGDRSLTYHSNTKGAFVLKSGEKTVTKINEINGIVNWITINNNVYFATNNGAYVLETKQLIDSILKISNLKKIDNDYDETILNTINYLNRESNYFVNLNKMKVINKTLTSATIEAIKGKYRGQITVNYKIKNQNEIINIDLNDLLKKGIYFDFINKNFYSFDKIKDIKDINIENLNFWNVEVTRDSKLLHSVDFKNACPKREKINKSSIIKTLRIPKCQYNSTSKISFQIIKGLTKTNQENKLLGWNIDIEDEIKLSDFVSINNRDSKIINELSDKFDISNINKQEQVQSLDTFNEDEDELQIAPKERVEFKYLVREINLETELNLKQKITGIFSAKIINDKNQEETIILSPKEAMQTLQKYSLLPNEFDINEDNSITFNGKAKISLTQERKPDKIENYFSI